MMRAYDMLHAAGHLVVTQGRAASFTPANIAGLQLWLTADAGVYQDAAGATAATQDGDPVGLWQDQSGNGYHVSQDTTSKKPVLKLGANGINSRAAVLFDGIDDLLTRTVANWLSTDSAGSVFAAIRLTNPANYTSTILATFDAATVATSGMIFLLDNTEPICRTRLWQRNNGDVTDDTRGDTQITTAAAHVVVYRSNGAAYAHRIDAVDQALTISEGTNSGDWFADTSIRDNITVGSTKWSAEDNRIKGDIAEILVYNSNLTGADLTNVETYLNDRYAAY